MEASDSFFFMSNRFNLIWFKTKKEAYLYIEDLKKKNLFNGQVVIAYEYLSVGSRRFIVILYEEFLSFYSKLRPNDRSFYEVLSTDLFCKLYIDIEIDKIFNPLKDWFSGFIVFMNQLNMYISMKCGVNCYLFGKLFKAEDTPHGEYIIMDASNDKKFSRHIILHLYNTILFRNQFEVRKFILEFNAYLMDIYKAEVDGVSDIIIKHETLAGIIEKTFIDITVYKSNQQFRFIGSSKFKENGIRPLNIMTSMVACTSKIDTIIFMNSLISYKEENVVYEKRYLYPIMQAKRPALKINMQPSSHINLIIPMISLDPIYQENRALLLSKQSIQKMRFFLQSKAAIIKWAQYPSYIENKRNILSFF